jgi:hypothetical protein
MCGVHIDMRNSIERGATVTRSQQTHGAMLHTSVMYMRKIRD